MPGHVAGEEIYKAIGFVWGKQFNKNYLNFIKIDLQFFLLFEFEPHSSNLFYLCYKNFLPLQIFNNLVNVIHERGKEHWLFADIFEQMKQFKNISHFIIIFASVLLVYMVKLVEDMLNPA